MVKNLLLLHHLYYKIKFLLSRASKTNTDIPSNEICYPFIYLFKTKSNKSTQHTELLYSELPLNGYGYSTDFSTEAGLGGSWGEKDKGFKLTYATSTSEAKPGFSATGTMGLCFRVKWLTSSGCYIAVPPTLPPPSPWPQTMDLCHPVSQSQGVPPSSRHNVSAHFPVLSQQDRNNSRRNYGHVRRKILSKLQLVHNQGFHKVSFSHFKTSLGEEKTSYSRRLDPW